MKGYSTNNIKVSFIHEPRFFINEKKRTVTCLLCGRLSGPEENVWPSLDFPAKSIEVRATAKCNKNDVFDIERGKRIAESKAENSFYNEAAIEVSRFAEKLDFLRSACNEFAAKSIRCQAHNIDYIDSLSMPAHPLYCNKVLPKKSGIVIEHIK